MDMSRKNDVRQELKTGLCVTYLEPPLMVERSPKTLKNGMGG